MKIIRFVSSLSGEFVVFAVGTISVAAGAWIAGGPAAGLISAGVVLLGDVTMGRIIEVKTMALQHDARGEQ